VVSKAKPRRTRNIAVFCSGSGSNFQAIIEAFKRKSLKASIVLMVCDNPKAYALKRAADNQIPVCLISPKLFPSREAYERVIVSILKSQKVDLVVLAGFMRILTPYFINAYRNKIVNIHPSYLPAFKGAHGIRDAFNAGVRETGVTVHFVTNKLDSGKIIEQKKIKISKNDTLESLEKKIHALEHKIYPKAILKLIEKNCPACTSEIK
jgi:phosphoribosylglycinamide formyltransferase 1